VSQPRRVRRRSLRQSSSSTARTSLISRRTSFRTLRVMRSPRCAPAVPRAQLPPRCGAAPLLPAYRYPGCLADRSRFPPGPLRLGCRQMPRPRPHRPFPRPRWKQRPRMGRARRPHPPARHPPVRCRRGRQAPSGDRPRPQRRRARSWPRRLLPQGACHRSRRILHPAPVPARPPSLRRRSSRGPRRPAGCRMPRAPRPCRPFPPDRRRSKCGRPASPQTARPRPIRQRACLRPHPAPGLRPCPGCQAIPCGHRPGLRPRAPVSRWCGGRRSA
jgi:hypothetical protein